MATKWSGVFVIPVTPFHTDLSVDEASFRKEIHFCLECGVRGIVYPAVVSEFFTLDPDERARLLELIVHEVGGQIPVIAGVSAPSSPYATKLARRARELGAEGAMSMLPYVHHFFAPDLDYALQHLRMVASAGLPIIFQNARIGYPLPLAQLPRIAAEVPEVRAIKEETSPSTHQLGRAVDILKGQDVLIFGGLGGIYLVDEVLRGAAGTMPAPPFADVLVDAFTATEQGQIEAARSLLASCAPAFTYELLYNVGFIKEVLVQRGILTHATCRVPAPAMDAIDRKELATMLERIAPAMRVQPFA